MINHILQNDNLLTQVYQVNDPISKGFKISSIILTNLSALFTHKNLIFKKV